MKEAVHNCAEWRQLPSRANGQVALAYYHHDEEAGRFISTALDVVTFEGPLIKEITAFVTPEIFPRFDLSGELPDLVAERIAQPLEPQEDES